MPAKTFLLALLALCFLVMEPQAQETSAPEGLVRSQLPLPGDGQHTARLNVYPAECHAGEPVRLEVHLEPETEGAMFAFEFGDGQRSGLQPGQTTEHRYVTPGAYNAIVTVYRRDRMVAESRPVSITVMPGVSHRLFLETGAGNPDITGRVRFTWRIEPPVAGVLYHVDFGDGDGGWTSEAGAEHPYKDSGVYRALLRARIGGKDIQSNEVVVTVREAVRSWLYMPLAIGLGAAGSVALVWWIIARARKRKRGGAAKAGSIGTPMAVRVHKDLGTFQVEFSLPFPSGNADVRVKPVPDSGEQAIEQGIVIHKRRKEGNYE